jgi:hypothetical protein
MDLFYKPPLERPDECASLEENYLNCMFQKALRDRVVNERCVMDSILWFHLECPKAVAKFDDPIMFKRKVRDFIAEAKTAMEAMTETTDEIERVRNEYDYISYPEDVKEHKELRQFNEVFDKYSPVVHPDPEDDFENEELGEDDEDIDPKEAQYGRIPDALKIRPLKESDSIKFRGK